MSIFFKQQETHCSVLVSLSTAGKQAWRRREVPGTGNKAPDTVPCAVLSGHGRRLTLETTQLPDSAEDEGLLTQGQALCAAWMLCTCTRGHGCRTCTAVFSARGWPVSGRRLNLRNLNSIYMPFINSSPSHAHGVLRQDH